MPARLKLLELAQLRAPKERASPPLTVTPRQLADVELLMRVLSGPPARRRELALRLVSEGESLWHLARQSRAELRAAGLGPDEATRLAACLELGRRSVQRPHDGRAVLQPRDAYDCVAAQFAGEERERFVAVVLDIKNRPRQIRVVAEGAVDACPVDPREVFTLALRERGSAVLVAHNHPSGDASASPEDLALTRRLADAGELLGIPLLDHIIVGRATVDDEAQFTSLAEQGVLGRRLGVTGAAPA